MLRATIIYCYSWWTGEPYIPVKSGYDSNIMYEPAARFQVNPSPGASQDEHIYTSARIWGASFRKTVVYNIINYYCS